MHLPQAYRSLPRPSSLSKPSHPPTGVVAPAFWFILVVVVCKMIVTKLIHILLIVVVIIID
jgi:hypothetical protein